MSRRATSGGRSVGARCGNQGHVAQTRGRRSRPRDPRGGASGPEIRKTAGYFQQKTTELHALNRSVEEIRTRLVTQIDRLEELKIQLGIVTAAQIGDAVKGGEVSLDDIQAITEDAQRITFADYDGDGYLDAFVANDTTQNFLFHNLKGKKFEEVALPAGVGYAPDGVARSGMGADFRDVNNDGLPDIWHTAVENEEFPLWINNGKGEFEDVTVASGLRSTNDMSGWGAGMADFDNDGWKDLFVARSNVMDNISIQNSARRYPEPNTIFRNLGNGRFEDVSAAAGPDFQVEAAHRGVAFGDLDNDGRVDMVVSVLNGPAELFHNITDNNNHWILLKLVGTKSNRMAIGAQIKITTEDGKKQWNEVTTAVGYASSSDPRVHFGLGKNDKIKEIEIRWPSGIKQILNDVAVDRILTIEEPAK